MRFEDYKHTGDHFFEATRSAPAFHRFDFDSLDGMRSETFEWPCALTGPLQGDVLVSMRTELKVPVVRLKSARVRVHTSKARVVLEAPRFITKAEEVEAIALLCGTREARSLVEKISEDWRYGSFVHICRL